MSAFHKADHTAAKAARAVADYPLVKCAVNGADPNWGRIICAVGSAGVKLNLDKLSCKLGDITVFRNGRGINFDPKRASKIVGSKQHTITVNIGVGKYSDFLLFIPFGSRFYLRQKKRTIGSF